MTEQNKCPNCGKAIAAGAPGCPSCLIALAMPNQEPKSNRPTAVLSGLFYAPRPEEIASLFPQLDIVELLGHGGMGAVYKARQLNLDRLVALKLLSPRLNDDPSFAERFTREARTLAKLNHPNIVTVYDFGQAGDVYFLIMELVDGVNMRDAIASRTIAPEEALAIVPKICEALQYAHDEGVIHRDIKPENILLGKKDQVKIADFGLAKLLEPTQGEFTLTGTQQVLGTRNYMAPEQIERPTQVDHRADIYSLGVVFYELLTGELPLGRFSLPSEKAQLNSRLDDVVLRTLEKEPDKRYQQASQIKTAVESIDDPTPQVEPMKSPLPKSPVVPPESRRVTVPFKITDVHGGFSESLGIAHFDGVTLDMEYETTTLSFAKSAPETVTIPAYDIVSARYNEGVFSDSIEIQTAHLEAAAGVPTANQGRFKLVIKKSDSELAEEFVDMLNENATGQPGPGPSKDGKKGVPRTPPGDSVAYLPFKITGVHGGMSEAIGIANVIGDRVLVDYEIKDGFGISKSSAKKVSVPISEMISINHYEGVFGDRIDIQMNRLDASSKIPASTQGRIKLNVKKSDRELSENFIDKVVMINERLAPSSVRNRRPSDAQQIARADKKLRLPVSGLKIVAIVNIIILLFAITVQLTFWLGLSNTGNAIHIVSSTLAERELAPDNVVRTIGNIGQKLSGPTFAISWTIQTLLFVVIFWFGANRMRQRKNYHLVFAIAVLALLPIHAAAIVGIPFGIIAVVVLCQPYVRDSFDRRVVRAESLQSEKGGNPSPPSAPESTAGSNEVAKLLRAVLLFAGLLIATAAAAGVVVYGLAAPDQQHFDSGEDKKMPAPQVQTNEDSEDSETESNAEASDDE